MGKWWNWALAVLVVIAPAQAQDSAQAPAAAKAGAPAPVDVDRFLQTDAYGQIRISPDGKHFAATAEWNGRIGLVVFQRSDFKVVSSAAGDKGSEIKDFWWVNDERVVFSTAQRFGSRDEPYSTGLLYSLGLGSNNVKLLAGGLGAAASLGLSHARHTEKAWEMAAVIDTLPGEERDILVSTWEMGPDPKTRVDRVDVYNGAHKIVTTAPVRNAAFVTDARGEVRFAVGTNQDNYSQLYYRENAQADWRLLNDQARSSRIEEPVGFAADGTTAYLRVSQDKGADVIVAFDTATGERKQVMGHPTSDPWSLIHEADGRTLAGVQFMANGVSSQLLDDKHGAGRLQRALEKAMAGAAVSITSFTADGSQALVHVWSDRNPGDVYVIDTAKLTAATVFSHRKWLPRDTLAATREVTLPARDGMQLHGYLTLPRGDAGKPAPMVVLPHGGPYERFDDWGYDDEVQMLAQAGYAVLRLNFRGSGNYGRAYTEAGARQWGAAMQDDLTDATRWAIAQKVADADRICIYGASYGGYAALMGVTREPSLYRCAVGYVGVYDLEAMHRKDSNSTRGLRIWAEDWLGERDELSRRSPVLMADRIKVPVMLAAGGEDEIAPISHSKQMERALYKAGVPVETLYYDTEGHGFYTPEHRREFYVRLLDFLGRHIGGARAAPAAAGAGTKTAR